MNSKNDLSGKKSAKEIRLMAEERSQEKERQRLRAEEAINLNNKQLALAQRAAGAGFWDWDMATGILHWSPELFWLFGLNPKTNPATFDVWRDIIYPPDRMMAEERINDAIRDRIPLSNEYRVMLPTGELRWIFALGDTFYDEKGTALQMTGICLDITERKKMEQELIESRENLSITLQSIGDGVIACNQTGTIINMNSVAETMTGWKLTDALGKSIVDVFHIVNALTREPVENPVHRVLKEGKIVGLANHTVLISRDGKEYQIADCCSPIRNAQNQMAGCVFVFRDVTEAYAKEAALKENERRFRELFENSLSGVALHEIVVDENGEPVDYTFLEVNPAFEIQTGMKVSETIGRNVTQLIPGIGSSGLIRLYGKVALTGEPETFEIFFEPHQRYYQISAFQVGKGRFAAVFNDITTRVKAEESLILAKEKAEESNRLKTHFLANMSHEIRTPMNGILGFLDLLKDMTLEKEEKDRYFTIVQRSGLRLLDTINNIIEVSKIETTQISVDNSETNIRSSMQYLYDFFKPQADEKGLKLSIHISPELDHEFIQTDKYKLESILTNLLKNAIKFTKEGEIEFGNYQEGRELVIYVKDTGPGIPADRLEAVFDRFVQADLKLTRAHEGSGLGLTISKAYAEMLGGHVHVKSEEGKGSVFYLVLPFNPERKMNEEQETNDPVPDWAHRDHTILVAEDDEDSQVLLKTLLQSSGLTVILCNNGEDAVKIVRENSSLSLVLMDIRMPLMDGIEATKQIRQFNKSTPVIAQSAYAFREDQEMALAAGCNDYITKPVSRLKLKEVLSQYL